MSGVPPRLFESSTSAARCRSAATSATWPHALARSSIDASRSAPPASSIVASTSPPSSSHAITAATSPCAAAAPIDSGSVAPPREGAREDARGGGDLAAVAVASSSFGAATSICAASRREAESSSFAVGSSGFGGGGVAKARAVSVSVAGGDRVRSSCRRSSFSRSSPTDLSSATCDEVGEPGSRARRGGVEGTLEGAPRELRRLRRLTGDGNLHPTMRGRKASAAAASDAGVERRRLGAEPRAAAGMGGSPLVRRLLPSRARATAAATRMSTTDCESDPMGEAPT